MAACTCVSSILEFHDGNLNRFEFGWIDNLFAFEIVNLRI